MRHAGSAWSLRWHALKGDAIVWLCAAAASLALLAVLGLLFLLGSRGLGHFWPRPLYAIALPAPAAAGGGMLLGERVRRLQVPAQQLVEAGELDQSTAVGRVERWLLRIGNRDHWGEDFRWLLLPAPEALSRPPWAMRVERRSWGPLLGTLSAMELDGRSLPAVDQAERWQQLQQALQQTQGLRAQLRALERDQVVAVGAQLARLEARTGSAAPAAQATAAALRSRLAALNAQRQALQAELDRYAMRVLLADGSEVVQPLAEVLHVLLPNRMDMPQRSAVFVQRVWEFLSTSPRDANSEGGVFPAIFGTVTLVMLMSIMVTPVGVLAAVYLHEYARQGPLTRLIRIAVNNLAGVPSLVYGVFGLGFFVYVVGGELDQWLFAERLPSPTFGTPGLLWAALTLALLTLPVVVVATEEGLARIPRSLREGSLALGATRAETLWRVVLPMASPAMLTGLILAVARAAGEVAPLMLVGVVKLADELPVSAEFPWLNLEQKFMHLGFHIYDVGFQSPNPDASRPLVYATAFLLVSIIVLLNLLAIMLRHYLREKYKSMDT